MSYVSVTHHAVDVILIW